MSGVYTQRRHEAAAVVLADSFNDEVRAALAELNGGLGQHNLPLASVDYSKLVGMVAYTNGTTVGRVGPANAYYYSEQADGDGVSWDLTNDDWQLGWNSFNAKMSANGGDVLTFLAREGMVRGAINCSTAYRQIEKSGTLGTGVWGSDYWHEVGVFVNDVMVARTGQIRCMAPIIDLPFVAAVGNGTVVVDVRWRAYNNRQGGTTSSAADWASIFYVYGSHLWARNQYR